MKQLEEKGRTEEKKYQKEREKMKKKEGEQEERIKELQMEIERLAKQEKGGKEQSLDDSQKKKSVKFKDPSGEFNSKKEAQIIAPHATSSPVKQ